MSAVPRQDLESKTHLRRSLAATAAVMGAPVLCLLAMFAWPVVPLEFPWILLGPAASVLLASWVGALLWKRSPDSKLLSFGELMVWTWARRRRVDETAIKSVDRLGLDRSGRRVRRVRISSQDQLAMLRQLSDGLEVKDPYTRHHSSRVERHSFQIALAMGLTSEDIEILRRAASVHDVGKIHVRDEVLRKPDKLTDEERLEVEKHPVTGARMVGGLGDARISSAVRHHHERWDGRGYPDGLSGEKIPLFARIIAVADTYDAITSTRAYRPRTSSARARKIICEESGAQFDPRVVEAFLTTLADRTSVLSGFLGFSLAEKMWGRLARSARRVGTRNLSPALASIFILTAVAPSFVSPQPPSSRVNAPVEADGLGSVPSVAHETVSERDLARAIRSLSSSDRDMLLGKVLKKPGAKDKGKIKRARGKGLSAASAHPAPGDASSEGGGAKLGPSGGGAPSLEPVAEGVKPPAVLGAGKPAIPDGPTGVAPAIRAPTDPQVDKGKDCQKPKDNRGITLHCP